MEYDIHRQRYVGEDGRELRVTPYNDGKGYKYDYYDKSTYNNNSHSSSHIKSDLNGNWERTDNDRSDEKNTQTHTSVSGCYLTTACMKHYLNEFKDDCFELTVLRWFRDNYVNESDVRHYYEIAPKIVENIEKEEKKDIIYNYIYDNVVDACVEAITNGDYEFAYNRYKNSIISFEETFVKNTTKVLKKV